MLTGFPQISGTGLKSSQVIALISFFLLFPGFLFYHQFLAMGLITPFAAGFFGYVSLGTLLAFLILLPWNTNWIREIISVRYLQWVLVFLIYTSVWTIAHYLLLDEEHIKIASRQSLETIIFWTCLFLIGVLLPLESKLLHWLFLLSFIVIFVFLLYFFLNTDANSYYARRIYGNMANLSTYQGFARSVLITLLLLLAVFNSFRTKAFFILGGTFVLFMLISRSDFYAFLAVSAALCVIYGIKQPKYFLLLLLVSLEVILLAAPDITPRIKVFLESRTADIVVSAPPVDTLPVDDGNLQTPAHTESSSADETASNQTIGRTSTQPAETEATTIPRVSRQFEVLDISSSKSWTGRLALQKIALGQIAETPVLGKFGGHVLTEDTGQFTTGYAGRYAHNALSAWVTYGLVGFLLYVSLTLYGFLASARQIILKRRNTLHWMFAFMLNFVCLLLIIASKSVYWPLPALAWGIVINALIHTPPRNRGDNQSTNHLLPMQTPNVEQMEIIDTSLPISGNSKFARSASKKIFPLSS